MKLYLIETKKVIYATSASSGVIAMEKFLKEYPDYDAIKVKEIPVESLIKMENNDDIIFF